MAKKSSQRLTTDEERQVREAELRLDALLRVAEQAHTEGRLADEIRDTPGIREQLESTLDT